MVRLIWERQKLVIILKSNKYVNSLLLFSTSCNEKLFYRCSLLLFQSIKIQNKLTSEEKRGIVRYNFCGKSLWYLTETLWKCQFPLIKSFTKVLFNSTVWKWKKHWKQKFMSFLFQLIILRCSGPEGLITFFVQEFS